MHEFAPQSEQMWMVEFYEFYKSRMWRAHAGNELHTQRDTLEEFALGLPQIFISLTIIILPSMIAGRGC